MNNNEKWVLDRLKNFHLLEMDIEQMSNRLVSTSYKVTATYGLTAGGSNGLERSKVESLSIRRLELEKELNKKREVVSQLRSAIKYAGLDRRERDLMICTMKGYSLSGYARQRNIYKSHIYKIRDKALRKMAKYIFETHK